MAQMNTREPGAADFDVETQERDAASLQNPHREILTRAILNVLSGPIAKITYGQIVNGLPLSEVTLDSYEGTIARGHPLLDQHLELSSKVLDKLDQLYSTFDPETLRMSSTLLSAFRAASPGSRAFHIRLIGLVARSVHQIAVLLFKQSQIRPESDPLLSWRPSEDSMSRSYPKGFPPTFFAHKWYRDYDQYPEGVADGVGYWAESRILGGVVVFDRRTPGSAEDVETDAIYLHSDNRDGTYRIYRLLDNQKQQLLQFLLSEVPPSSCPLPIHGNMDNRNRVDPEEPMKDTGIYRDKWERKLRPDDEGDARLRDVIDDFNYVSYDEWADAQYRAMIMRERRELGEHLAW
ncbi:hypothetical protein GGS23DRAFT_443312 [Durotheca rogersii]|uniref:uncharacterized protein n=1 Tax=Durotheca rogersii TaxID=419775 RepID=UPI00221E99FB|nr:uncharacterized protein GGS23DRAFT_443312 [Durotheca rogersii]KAI5855531.1 hypothetical protein GGS23DRAFT_443312 [Durotheca rogersii]